MAEDVEIERYYNTRNRPVYARIGAKKLRMRKWNAINKRFRRLLKPDTWQRPKNIWTLLIIAILLPILIGLAIDFGNNWIEAHLKTVTISIDYRPIARIKADEVEDYARNNGFAPFERNLDDNVFSDYFVIPIIIKNTTYNPVHKLSLDVDLGCSYAKILDVKYVVKSPKSRILHIYNTLPQLKWIFPTNQQMRLGLASINLEPEPNGYYIPPDTGSRIFFSLVPERGFGMVLSQSPGELSERSVPIVSSRIPSCFYFMNVSGRQLPNSALAVSFLPNPAYRWQFVEEAFRGSSNQLTAKVGLLNEQMNFLHGKTTINCESGFPSRSEIELFILAKCPPGQTISPSIKLDGAPGVNMREVDLPPKLLTQDMRWHNLSKRALMPLFVDAWVVSNGVVLCWDITNVPQYAGVEIYRSKARPIGDFGRIGDEIFVGYGDTDSFELKFPDINIRYPQNNARTQSVDSHEYISKPPPATKSLDRIISNLPPEPPQNVRVEGYYSTGQTVLYSNLIYFHDKLQFTKTNLTYTVYAIDRHGNASYPVAVNVFCDWSQNKCIFHPTPYLALNARGCIYLKQQRYEKAIEDFTAALHVDPQNFVALENRSVAYVGIKDYKNAISDLTALLKIYSKLTYGYCQRGCVYAQDGQFTKATNDFQKALRINPEFADAYNFYAWFLATCPNPAFRNGKEAVKFAKKACKLTDWKKWYCVGTLAAAYADAGNFDEAIKYQTQAMNMGGISEHEKADAQKRLDLYHCGKSYHESE